MSRNKMRLTILALSVLVICMSLVVSCVHKEQKSKFEQTAFTIDEFKNVPQSMITGVVVVYGTDKFNYVGLTGEDRRYYKLVGNLEEKLYQDYQTQEVTLLVRRGKLDDVDLVTRLHVDEILAVKKK